MSPRTGLLAARIALIALLPLTGCRAPAPVTTAPTSRPVAATVGPPGTPQAPAGPGPTEASPAYLDATLPIVERVEDLLSRMTLAEKVGQMTQVENGSIRSEDITTRFIGSILSGGGGYPNPNTPEAWLDMVNGFQEYALQTRLGIPLIYGADAVHGHSNVRGATIFPHNVGLGATRDADLVQRIGRATAEEMAATGVTWNFGPGVMVPQDIRWGRTYEGYSENTELVSTLAAAYIRGLQSAGPGSGLSDPATVLATPKHYVGDGGTAWGSSTIQGYALDQGETEVDEATLRAVHLPPYQAAIDAGAMCIMVSFSSWGGVKMHAQKYLLTDVLKGELGFQGFLISDWQAIDQLPGSYYSDVVTAINAGLDMIMVPYDYVSFIDTLTSAVNRGDVPMERIDDAVRRILTCKFALGLFEHPFTSPEMLGTVGSAEHRELARQAVRESLVLLKNDRGTLPLAKDAPLILVTGSAADDIGMQCGGWTIEWQGRRGNVTPGTTILEGIRDAVSPGAEVRLLDRTADQATMAEIGIAVVGEGPYAEGKGDSASLALTPADVDAINTLRAHCRKLVLVIVSGRPIIITDQLPLADAVVAAWWPGTEGQGVADVLFGDYPFTGKLAYTWPRSASQLPFDLAHLPVTGNGAPLFAFGYGLDAQGTASPASSDCT